MSTNPGQEQSAKVLLVNKQIVEIKKKIQLSEGQRKALFEECETERKANADEILKLKKEISQLVLSLHENRSAIAKYKLQSSRLEEAIGPVGQKTCTEVKELLDLQIIDKTKQLNLLRYRTKQREQYLTSLGNEYQVLTSHKAKKHVTEKIVNPVKKAACELQNSIHAVEVQCREAVHIRNRYKEIKKSLQEDSARFESNIKRVEDELKLQNVDLEQLQKISEEATRMRSQARGILSKEERACLTSANTRTKQSEEGKRLVAERKQELEKVERRIFQGGKITMRQEPEATDEVPPIVESPVETPPHPVEEMAQAFEILKQATGATSTEEVLERFRSQKETLQRLALLRKTSEKEKGNLENQQNSLTIELERFKYAQDKDMEQNSDKMEGIQKQIEKQVEETINQENQKKKVEETLIIILGALNKLFCSVNPLAIPLQEPLETINGIKNCLNDVIKKLEEQSEEEEKEEIMEIHEEKWLPPPYSGLIRRTPLPQSETSPAPPAATVSEDEEEVPSRSFLKRQAQLMVDTKSRRKNVRIQLPRRK